MSQKFSEVKTGKNFEEIRVKERAESDQFIAELSNENVEQPFTRDQLIWLEMEWPCLRKVVSPLRYGGQGKLPDRDLRRSVLAHVIRRLLVQECVRRHQK